MNLRRLAPNAISFLSLLSGIFAIYDYHNGNFIDAFFMLIIAAIADMLDGKTARFLKCENQNGTLIDCLVDFFNYGIAVSTIFGIYIYKNFRDVNIFIILLISLFFTVSIGLRLFRFYKNSFVQSKFFIGLPAPISGLLFLTMPVFFNSEKNILIISRSLHFKSSLEDLFIFLLIIFYLILMILLPISNIKFFSGKDISLILKFIKKDLKLKIISLILIIFLVSSNYYIFTKKALDLYFIFSFNIFTFLIFYIIFNLSLNLFNKEITS